jgi:hypothetical protein
MEITITKRKYSHILRTQGQSVAERLQNKGKGQPLKAAKQGQKAAERLQIRA